MTYEKDHHDTYCDHSRAFVLCCTLEERTGLYVRTWRCPDCGEEWE